MTDEGEQRLRERRADEKGRECSPCRDAPFCRRHRAFSLTDSEQTPKFRRIPFVQRGYLPPQLPLALCVKGVFKLNNETINVWTHLLGLAYFTGCQLYDNVLTLPRVGAHWQDHAIVSLTLFCFQVCMLLSACFHTFSCMSEWAHRVWFSLDLMGISTGLLGTYLSGIFYAFHCFHVWHNFYMALFCVLTVATWAFPAHPDYMTPKFLARRLAMHHCIYLALVLYGFVPTVHWVYLHAGAWTDPTVVRFLPNVLIAYALIGFAFAVYCVKLPERWYPGKFDFVGWSHQWWHLLTFLALAWWRHAGIQLLTFQRLANQCASN